MKVLKPLCLRDANAFVARYHRQCQNTWRNGGKFAIGFLLAHDGPLVGVVIAGRPVAATEVLLSKKVVATAEDRQRQDQPRSQQQQRGNPQKF
jgi:hypothetical protein